MTITSDDIVDAVVAALREDGITGGNVWSYRDWPTSPDELPITALDMPDEDKTYLGRAAPGFTVVADVPITVRVKAPASIDDGGALEVQQLLAVERRKVEVSIINRPSIMRLCQQIVFVRSRFNATPGGEQHFGEVVINIGFEFYQGPEDFHVITGDPIEAFAITTRVTTPDGVIDPGPSLEIDLPQ